MDKMEALKEVNKWLSWMQETKGPLPIYDAKVIKAIEQAFDDAQRYNELLMTVVNKYPDETCHDTALRYITRAEQCTSVLHARPSATQEPSK